MLRICLFQRTFVLKKPCPILPKKFIIQIGLLFKPRIYVLGIFLIIQRCKIGEVHGNIIGVRGFNWWYFPQPVSHNYVKVELHLEPGLLTSAQCSFLVVLSFHPVVVFVSTIEVAMDFHRSSETLKSSQGFCTENLVSAVRMARPQEPWQDSLSTIESLTPGSPVECINHTTWKYFKKAI